MSPRRAATALARRAGKTAQMTSPRSTSSRVLSGRIAEFCVALRDPGEALLEYGLLGWVGGQLERTAVRGVGPVGMA